MNRAAQLQNMYFCLIFFVTIIKIDFDFDVTIKGGLLVPISLICIIKYFGSRER